MLHTKNRRFTCKQTCMTQIFLKCLGPKLKYCILKVAGKKIQHVNPLRCQEKRCQEKKKEGGDYFLTDLTVHVLTLVREIVKIREETEIAELVSCITKRNPALLGPPAKIKKLTLKLTITLIDFYLVKLIYTI